MRSSAKTKLRQDIHSFPLEDDLLLFDELSLRLFHLNRTAALIWKGLEVGFTKRELIQTLAHSTGCSFDQLALDVENMLHQWQSLDLRECPTLEIERKTYPNISKSPSFTVFEDEKIPEISDSRLQFSFRLLNTRFRLKVPTSEELILVKPIVSHLLIDCDVECDVELIILLTNRRYVLLEDGKPTDWCYDISGIASMVHTNVVIISYDRTECFLGLHAAAVGYCEKCVLMPAVSGSGKSTLTAALIGSGFNYLADDLVLLSQPPIRMFQVPMALGLKTGSWVPLESFHPILSSLITHTRIDGKKIRYLAPPTHTSKWVASKKTTVDIIIFPQFDAGCNAFAIEKISAAEGLHELTEAGYNIRSQLTANKVRQLIDWIAGIPCYKLRFSQLSEAIDIILSLVK